MNAHWIILIYMISLLGCKTVPKKPPFIAINETFENMELTPFNPEKNLLAGYNQLKVPGSMLNMFSISRKYVDVRSGPGVNYMISDQTLEKGDRVILTDHSKIWRKVYCPSKRVTGWIHHKTIELMKKKPQEVIINKKYLPKVFTLKESTKGYSFSLKNIVKIQAPKGSPFYTLKRFRDKILVIIGGTQSVIWIDRKDAV